MAYNKILEDITPTEDHIKAYNENQQFEIEQANRADEWRRKKALNEIFSKHINGVGNLDNYTFYKLASENGLSPEQIREAMKHREAQIALNSKIATEIPFQKSAGFDTDAGGRNNASIGAPDAGSILPGMQKVSSPSAGGATTAPTADQVKANDALVAGLRNPSEVGAQTVQPEQPEQPEQPAPVAPVAPTAPTTTALDRLKAMRKSDIKEVQRELGFTGKQADGKVGALTAKRLRAALTTGSIVEGSNLGNLVNGTTDTSTLEYANKAGGQVPVTVPFPSKGEEAKMVPDNIGPDVFAPAPEDTRSFDQRFEDSYNPDNAVTASAGSLGAPEDKLFVWEPKDDGSNAFRKYETALKSWLNAGGYRDSSDFLHQIYAQTIKANMPTAPNEGLLALGKEGIAKYRGEQKAYQAGLQKAQGLAEEAVNKAKQGLVEHAKAYGVDTQTNEKHEADMGGRRAGRVAGSQIIRLYAVSEAEKTRGENIANAYLDLEESKELGGFEGDYAGAMAKAKSDGNVNADVITGHLIAMGAFPSEKSTYIKMMLSTTPSSAWDVVLKKAYAEIGNKFYADAAKRAKWYAGAEKNMKDAMWLVGYGILGDNPAPKKTAGDNPAPKKTAGDAVKRKAKKSPKTAPKGYDF